MRKIPLFQWLQHSRNALLSGVFSIAVLSAAGIIIVNPIFDTPAASHKVSVPSPVSTSQLSVPQPSPTSAIATENQEPGTKDWELDANANLQYLQGYASQVSAIPGQSVQLYVSSIAPITYTMNVYRIGWYNGLGGRLMLSAPNLQSSAQGYWTRGGLSNCGSCSYDAATNLIAANWKPSFTLTIGSNWMSGSYLVKLVGNNGAECYVPLVVRSDHLNTAILANIPVNTYQAYNVWGGYSLYGGLNYASGALIFQNRARKVSFDRPYDRSAGAGDFLAWDIHTVRWMERVGLDVSYTTDVDIDAHPELLTHHRVLIDIGHDEYWTKGQRDSIQGARDLGMSLAFFGADDAYWQARYETDSQNQDRRTLVCYKVLTPEPDVAFDPTSVPSLDPMYSTQPELTTTQFRDQILNRPENALLGEMYSSIVTRYGNGGSYVLYDWVASPGSSDILTVGTGLTPGEHIAGGVLGYEYDRVFNNGLTPPQLIMLGKSPVASYLGFHEEAATTYYRADSGALVFDAGSIWWGYGLDNFSAPGAFQTNTVHGNQKIANLTYNVIQAMLVASPPPNVNDTSLTSLQLSPLP